MNGKIVKKVIVLVMVFAMVAALSPTIPGKAVYAATGSAAQGIYDALIAEGSAFSNAKKQNEDYFIYSASLEDNRITITVNPTEEYAEYYNQYNTGNDSSYYDVGDDGYVSCTSAKSDYKTVLYLQAYIADAVAGYLKMDREIINKYMLAAQTETQNQTENASGDIVIDTQYFKVSQPDEHGLRDIKLYAGEKYSDSVVNELLDRVYFDEKTVQALDVEALTDTQTSSVVNTGKYGAVIDGNKYKVKMYFFVYGSDIDQNAYESIKNLVAALKPVGYDDFAAKYNNTSTEGGNVAATRTEWVVYPPNADDIQERFGSDTSFNISKHTFLAVEFISPYIWTSGTESMVAGEFTFYSVEGADEVKKWTSSNQKVATIDKDGMLVALKKGTTTITATLESGYQLTTTLKVTSNPAIKVSGKKYSKSKTYTIKKGKSLTVTIEGKAHTVDNKYKSSKKKVAKVTSKKTAEAVKIKGLKKGKSTVTVTVNGVAFKIKVKVK